jgi:hypothetical protein
MDSENIALRTSSCRNSPSTVTGCARALVMPAVMYALYTTLTLDVYLRLESSSI